MPDEQLTSRYTPQWQKIGFQGKDPATDFRAMGMLGLDDLLYLAKNYPSIASRILAASHHSQSWFSFAIVGISMTAYCLRLVRTRQLQYYFYTCGISENVYHEVYCYMFDAFEKHWSSLSPPPSVLDFNQIFRSFQIQMELQILGRDLPILKESRVLETKKRV
ncbi:Engulfment/cell motility [Gorgonomyces haynaldii]|nr:Engulfment/cell motility [Gorgonomyces haynaldii]